MDTSDRPPIPASPSWRVAWFFFTFGAALVVGGFVQLWPDPYALSMGAYAVGLVVVSVTFLRWNLLRHSRATQRRIDRGLAAYETVVDQLNVVLEALPDELPEDARRAVWNIREELRLVSTS